MAATRTAARSRRRRTSAGAPVSTAPRVENRQLDALIGLRMTSDQKKALEWKAKKLGFKTAQDWIREMTKPEVEQAVAEKRAAENVGSLAAAS